MHVVAHEFAHWDRAQVLVEFILILCNISLLTQNHLGLGKSNRVLQDAIFFIGKEICKYIVIGK